MEDLNPKEENQMDISKNSRFKERGEIRFGSIVWILIIAVAVFLAYKLVPIKMAYYNFEDTMVEQAKFANSRHIDEDGMRFVLLNKAKELELPIRGEDIVINWTSNHISIKATWTVDVNLLGYIKHWTFEAKADNPIFD